MDYFTLSKDLSFVLMVGFIMVSAGLAKEFKLFAPAVSLIQNTVKNNRLVIILISAIGGVLPIEGRVVVSAGFLDSISLPTKNREKLGIIDFISTHHYYLWSPLEKTVILPIAAFGFSYVDWIKLVLPILTISVLYIGWYIWTNIHNDDVHIPDVKFNIWELLTQSFPMVAAIGLYIYGIDKLICFGLLPVYYIGLTKHFNVLKYINWNLLLIVASVIILGNFIKLHSAELEEFIKTAPVNMYSIYGFISISVFAFMFSFFTGSSGKFIAMAIILSQLFGHEYFLWFFTLEYAAYLVSPTHKCVAVGNQYFGTSISTYYNALITWGVLLTLTTGLLTYLNYYEIFNF